MSAFRFRAGWRRLLLSVAAWLVVAGLVCSVPSVAFAQGGSKSPRSPRTAENAGRVKIDVMVVHANNTQTVDPRLKGLQRQLSHFRYTGFSVLSTSSESLSQGQLATINVVGGRQMKIRFLERGAEQARVRIELFRDKEKKLDTTIAIRRGRTFLVAGPRYRDGVLMFPITVSY
ncbi:MAG: hypothetical protein KTR31_07180 [Myxococcales bacterium]|nr:hypothetical protein [Myxococcales bacterium]